MIRWTGLAPWEFEFPFPGASRRSRAVSRRARDRPPRPQFKSNQIPGGVRNGTQRGRGRGGAQRTREARQVAPREREFFIDNLLVRIHFIIEMIWWTGLAPWEFEFPFPGSITSTFPGEEGPSKRRYRRPPTLKADLLGRDAGANNNR